MPRRIAMRHKPTESRSEFLRRMFRDTCYALNGVYVGEQTMAEWCERWEIEDSEIIQIAGLQPGESWDCFYVTGDTLMRKSENHPSNKR